MSSFDISHFTFCVRELNSLPASYLTTTESVFANYDLIRMIRNALCELAVRVPIKEPTYLTHEEFKDLPLPITSDKTSKIFVWYAGYTIIIGVRGIYIYRDRELISTFHCEFDIYQWWYFGDGYFANSNSPHVYHCLNGRIIKYYNLATNFERCTFLPCGLILVRVKNNASYLMTPNCLHRRQLTNYYYNIDTADDAGTPISTLGPSGRDIDILCNIYAVVDGTRMPVSTLGPPGRDINVLCNSCAVLNDDMY